MSEITYEAIRNLVKEERVEGTTVFCRFECPDHGTAAEAKAAIQVQRDIKSSVGHGVAGQVARSTANDAMQGAREKSRVSRSEIEAAVVDAFRTVEMQFRWDEEQRRFVGTPQ